MNDQNILTPPYDIATRIAMTPAALRIALARLARGADDHAHALSLLLLLRAAADGHRSSVELTSHDDGALATIERAPDEPFIAELLPVTMPTIEAVLCELPDLAASFARWCDGSGVVLRALGAAVRVPPARPSQRLTPPELPSLALLVEAGLAPRDALGEDG